MSPLYVKLDDEAKLVVWHRDRIAIEQGKVADLVRSAVRRMRSKVPPDGVDLAYGDHLLKWKDARPARVSQRRAAGGACGAELRAMITVRTSGRFV